MQKLEMISEQIYALIKVHINKIFGIVRLNSRRSLILFLRRLISFGNINFQIQNEKGGKNDKIKLQRLGSKALKSYGNYSAICPPLSMLWAWLVKLSASISSRHQAPRPRKLSLNLMRINQMILILCIPLSHGTVSVRNDDQLKRE